MRRPVRSDAAARPAVAVSRSGAAVAALVALSALAARVAGAQLTIVLPALPPGTPPDAAVHVAGPFNGWDPAARDWTLARRADGSRAITLPDAVRGRVEFKLALGSWVRVETDAGGADVPNRVVVVPPTGALTYTAVVPRWRGAGEAPPARASTARPGVTVLAPRPIPQLGGRERVVRVYLPPGYARSTRRYPVLYLQDGQNVFDAATSFAGIEWGVDEALDSLAASGARGGAGDGGAIVVAVDHGGPRRLDEYDPWRAADPRYGGGEGDAYVRFLAESLKPWVDRTYRTRPERAHTAVMGSSMGGLIALYAALRRPDVFGGAGVFSCACWIARDSLVAWVARARPWRPAPRLYFVVGDRESPDGTPVRDQRLVVATLARAGFAPGRVVRAEERAGGTHTEAFWRAEFPAAYRWLLGDGR